MLCLPPRRRLVVAAMGLAAAHVVPARARASETTPIIVAGNGGALGAMRLLAETYLLRNPVAEIQFLPSLGTSGGIAAALEGVVGIALAARALNERERASGARSVVYARTPFAFAVHPSVRTRDVAVDDVVRIYSGEMTTWPDGTLIRPVRRPHNDSVTLTLAAMSPAMRQAVETLQRRPGIPTAGNDQENAEALESVRGSFGPITLAQHQTERRRLALLSLDGIEPNVQAMVTGRYPVATTLHAVTRTDTTPEVAAFLAYVMGRDGRDVLSASGHEPLGQGSSS